MATAQVMLKVTPHELQIVEEALRWYAHEVKYVGCEEERKPLKIRVFGGEPLACSREAQNLIKQIGLK